MLLRRDAAIQLDGLSDKKQYLEALRGQFTQHRVEDIAQIKEARTPVWASWEERLRRLEEWLKEAAEIKRSSATLRSWKESAIGFERLKDITDNFSASLERRAKALEETISATMHRIQAWDGRLRAQEADLRSFLDRQAAKTTEIMVSKARKQPYLDFAFREREEEGQLSQRMKSIRSTANRMLDRLTKANAWVFAKAEQSPGYFESNKDEFMTGLAFQRTQFSELREKALTLALYFEEGRQRLRWIYEQIQRLRVVPDSPPVNKPLIERLFGSNE